MMTQAAGRPARHRHDRGVGVMDEALPARGHTGAGPGRKGEAVESRKLRFFVTLAEELRSGWEHNLHACDPTWARRGLGAFRIGLSAEAVRLPERLDWATVACWAAPRWLGLRGQHPAGDLA